MCGQSTTETYRSSLLLYHIFYNQQKLTEGQHVPALPVVITAFMASLAGCYSGKTLANYFYSVHTWHILHSVQWSINADEMESLLKAAGNLTPASSKWKEHLPFTCDTLKVVLSHIELMNPFDVAMWACLLCAFWSAAHVGEVTVRILTGFNVAVHAKHSDMCQECCGRTSLIQMACFIPKTKSASSGEDIFWSHQHRGLDPDAAVHNHLQVNSGPASSLLFAYAHKGTLGSFTVAIFGYFLAPFWSPFWLLFVSLSEDWSKSD